MRFSPLGERPARNELLELFDTENMVILAPSVPEQNAAAFHRALATIPQRRAAKVTAYGDNRQGRGW